MSFVWTLIVTALAMGLVFLMGASLWWAGPIMVFYLIGFFEGDLVARLKVRGD